MSAPDIPETEKNGWKMKKKRLNMLPTLCLMVAVVVLFSLSFGYETVKGFLVIL